MSIEHWRNAWQQLIAPGAPFEVMETEQGTRHFRHAPRTLQEVIESARIHGDREFIVWQDQRLTFTGFFDQVERLAGQLLARFGLQPGERVAIALRNQPAWLVAFAAVQRCGGVCVPLNSWGLRDELLHGLEDSGAGLLLCDEARLNLLQEDLTARQRTTLVVGLPSPSTLPDWCFRYEDLLAAEPLVAPQVRVEPDSPALILYTSGTTSRAKGALSSHRAVCQALTALEFQGMFCAMSSPERIGKVIASGFAPTTLMAVPLFHVSGLHAQFLSALRAGRRLVLMYKWDVDKAIDLIRDERCTQFNGAPVMMQQLLASRRFGGEDTVSLFGLGLGGGASSAGLLAAMAERKPDVIGGSGYGLTESNGIGAAIGGEQFLHRPASAGWPLPIVDVRLGDNPGQPLPPGQAGIIWLRSPTLMDAYWNLPEASTETLQGGWLNTGDIGYLDDQGFLCISGRIKELINRGGEKISAAEIEVCVGDMPGVEEVAVFAVPDEQLGEAVALVIQGEAPPTAEEARAFVAARLAGYKVPAHVFRVSEALPRNASGKVLKDVLRQQLLG
ncbi:class I adenylate-forming enzyme family protein [Pseudomonas wadenswilerensis]